MRSHSKAVNGSSPATPAPANASEAGFRQKCYNWWQSLVWPTKRRKSDRIESFETWFCRPRSTSRRCRQCRQSRMQTRRCENSYMAGNRSKLAVERLPKVRVNFHPGGWHEPNGQPDYAHHDRARRALSPVWLAMHHLSASTRRDWTNWACKGTK